MRCLRFHSALLPLRTQLNHRQQFWLPTAIETTKLASQRQHLLSIRAKAMHNAIVLGAVTAPAKSGDISVLLQTGGVLLFAYLFSNFVVPNLITKYFGFDKVGEDEDDDDDFQ